MVDREPPRLRDIMSAQDANSLTEMQPSVLRSTSASPLMESPLDLASSRVEQVIETMASYRGAKTPQLDLFPRKNPHGALKDIIKEKESELVNIAAQRNRALAEQLDRLQEQERKGKDEISKLRSQLKQLTKDFQYNLELVKDRDTELELMENQIKAHKETSEQRSQELADAIRHVDEGKIALVSCENRAEQALAQKAAAEERCANKLAIAQREHGESMSEVLSQLEVAKAQLQHEMTRLVDERQGFSVTHRQQIQQLEGQLAAAQAQLHTANAATEQVHLQMKQTITRCETAENNLRIAEDALGSLENEHRKFVDQASAVCSQKDEAIAELKAQVEVEKRLSHGQAVHDSQEHSVRVKDLEAAVSSEREVTASTVKQLHAVQAELLSCKAEHQKEAAESQKEVSVCQDELATCQRELGFIQQSFAAMEHEKNGDVGRSGDLLARAHMELQQRDGELQQLNQEVASLQEEIRCSESARNAACHQIHQLTSDMEKMALVHKTQLERAVERADSAEQKLKDLSKDRRALAAAIEKQAAAWGKKCESQAKAQRHEIAHLEKQWQSRLVQAEHEHADHAARQSAETAGVKEECNVAISRIRDAQEYVQMLEEHLHDQSKTSIMPPLSQLPAAPAAPPKPPPGTTPASPMHGAVVYSTTLNVPPSQSSSGIKACQCSNLVSAATRASFDSGVVGEHHVHHGAPVVPCGATLASCTAGCTPSAACACGYRHSAQGHAARVPLADAANIPLLQHGSACIQHQAVHLPSSGCWNNHISACGQHNRPAPVADYGIHGNDIYSGRYRSTSLMRMQRLQDRLKASERDLSYRLGRLLGRDADEACYGGRT